MNETMQLILNNYTEPIIIGFCAIIIILLILMIAIYNSQRKLKKRFDFFMGSSRRPDKNLEMLLRQCIETVNDVESKYSKILDIIEDIEKNMRFCTQKVGIVRYNPFEEMGGNLCFAVAILDANNNGVVLNGIHSRTGTYTYAKPIELGVSRYTLSQEEVQAIENAKADAYKAVDKSIVVDRPAKVYRMKTRGRKVRAEIFDIEQTLADLDLETGEINPINPEPELSEIKIDKRRAENIEETPNKDEQIDTEETEISTEETEISSTEENKISTEENEEISDEILSKDPKDEITEKNDFDDQNEEKKEKER